MKSKKGPKLGLKQYFLYGKIYLCKQQFSKKTISFEVVQKFLLLAFVHRKFEKCHSQRVFEHFLKQTLFKEDTAHSYSSYFLDKMLQLEGDGRKKQKSRSK